MRPKRPKFKRPKYLQYNIKLWLLVYFMERTLPETLLEIINGLIKFGIFSCRCILQP